MDKTLLVVAVILPDCWVGLLCFISRSEKVFPGTRLCYDLGHFGEAVRIYEEAFQQDDSLTKTPQLRLQFNAACCAALAESGQSLDGLKLNDVARSAIRVQAFGWLTNELDQWETSLKSAGTEQRIGVLQTMKQWQSNKDLASVRDAESLAKLSDVERAKWRTLWKKVDDLRMMAEGGN